MRAVLDRLIRRSAPCALHWSDPEYNSNGIFEVPSIGHAIKWSKETREQFPSTIVCVVSDEGAYEINQKGRVVPIFEDKDNT